MSPKGGVSFPGQEKILLPGLSPNYEVFTTFGKTFENFLFFSSATNVRLKYEIILISSLKVIFVIFCVDLVLLVPPDSLDPEI